VRIRPADSKGAHAGVPWLRPAHPTRQPVLNAHRKLLERNESVRPLEVETCRNRLVVESERGFDEPGNPGSRLEVTDVRLHGTDRAHVSGGAVGVEDAPERTELHRIAEARPGTVCLDVLDRARRDPRVLVGVPQHRALRLRVRSGKSVRTPILIHGRPANDGVDSVPVSERLREPLEDYEPRPFAADESVGAIVESLAPPVGGERAQLRETYAVLRRQDEVHAARESERRFAAPQTLASVVNRNQRGRARRVDRHAGPPEIERVGDAPRRDRAQRSGRGVHVDRRRAVPLHASVVVRRHPEEHPGRTSAQRGRRLSGVFERFPSYLEEEPLLGVHVPGLARRDPEE